MPRISRSKSHRQRRRSNSWGDAQERSDSDSEEERRRDYAVVSSSWMRDSGMEKSKFLQGSGEGNGVNVGKPGEESVEDLFVAVNRLSGDDWRDDGNEVRVDVDKVAVAMERAKGTGGGDWKENSALRHDAPGGRKDSSSSDWDESTKRRSEQDLCRSDRGNQHGDVKERDRERLSGKDRGYLTERRKDHDVNNNKERELEKVRQNRSERDRVHREETDGEHRLKRSREQLDDMDREHGLEIEVAVIQRDRSNDPSNKKSGSRLGDVEYTVKNNQENAYRWEHKGLHDSDLDKDTLKKVRRRDYYVDKEKHYEEDMDIMEKKLSSIDDHVRSGSYKDEKYREKRWEDFDKDEKSHYEKHQDGHSSGGHASVCSNIKHNMDENKHPENNSKKCRIEENGRESSPYDEYTMKYSDNREKKNLSVDIDYDPKPPNTKVLCTMETNIFDSCKSELADDRHRSETSKIKSCADNDRPVKASKWSSQVVKNECRSLKWAEATYDMSWPEEQQSIDPSQHPSLESMKCANVSVGKVDSPSVNQKPTPEEHLHDDFLVENISPASHLQTTLRTDGYSSPIGPNQRVHYSSSGRRHSKRMNELHHFDVEVEQRTNYPKDGVGNATKENKEHNFRFEKQEAITVSSQMELLNSDSIPVSSVSWNRTDPLSRCSPNPLRTSSVRNCMGSPMSGSDGDRFQAGDQNSNSCHKRAGEINLGSGHGNAMKGVLGWPSPVPNGFIPFQHGPPPGGFYPVVRTFPAPVFGIRSPLDLNHSGNLFLMNENLDRFSGHGCPFGWRNTVDDPFHPNLQRWDGHNIVGNGPYVHCQTDHSGSVMSSELLMRQNSMSFPYLDSNKEVLPSVHFMDDEVQTGQSSHQTSNELYKPQLEEGKGMDDNHITDNSKEISQTITLDKTSEATKLLDGFGVAFYSICLSKLDISPDLACPELYGKWTTSIGNKTDDDVMTKNDGVKRAVGISSRAGKLLFPALSDDVFQSAMSLYRKNGVKTDTPSNLPSKDMDISALSDAEKVVPGENTCKANLLATGNTCSGVEEDANKFADPVAGQGNLPTYANNLVEPKEGQGDFPIANHDGQSNNIYSAASCVKGVSLDGQSNITYNTAGFTEGSLGCEVLMQECRINLSRIHHSPESTH